MYFLQIEPLQFLDTVYKFGALPLLLLAVYMLWKKVDRHEKSITDLNLEQKADLRIHATEIGSIQQNTLNTLNELTHEIKYKNSVR